MRRIEAAVTALFERPWLLVILVALIVGVPVIAIGEVSANDTRSRARQAELNILRLSAQRAAATVNTMIDGDRFQLQQLAKSVPLRRALAGQNLAEVNTTITEMRAVLGPGTRRLFLVDDVGRVTAVSPAEPSLLDRILVDYRGLNGSYASAPQSYPPYQPSPGDPPLLPLAVAARPLSTTDQPVSSVQNEIVRSEAELSARRVLVADIELAQLGELLSPVLGSADDVYLVDDHGRLVLRVAAPGADFGRELGSEWILAKGQHAPGREAADPLGNGRRYAAAEAASALSWTVVVLRSPETAERELETSLGQLQLTRFVLVAVLIVAAFALALTGRQIARSRAALGVSNSQLEIANDQLEIATRHKSEFLANMSHELRTPLNAIIGFSDVLLAEMFGTVNAKQREYLGDIRGSGAHQLSLINDILDLSKVEAGRLELELGPVSVSEIIATGVSLLRERATNHSIALESEIQPDLPLINADARKLKQVVLNLLTNAVKFTPAGGRVLARVHSQDGEIVVAVSDTGVGIDPADQARIFAEFVQTRQGKAAEEGTGLGLTLAKKLVELHGGRIWVESQPGAGSTFTFTIPIRQTVST
jgi:signal transduction histidine kinase